MSSILDVTPCDESASSTVPPLSCRPVTKVEEETEEEEEEGKGRSRCFDFVASERERERALASSLFFFSREGKSTLS